jgi:hypothetical protein
MQFPRPGIERAAKILGRIRIPVAGKTPLGPFMAYDLLRWVRECE